MKKTLEFDEKTHKYTYADLPVPSVTEILSPITQAQYSAINPEILRQAADRGTDAHAACEAMDYDLEPEANFPETYGYMNAYDLFLREHYVEWEGIEEMGICTTNYTEYAGTVDRWGIVDGERAIVDIKTTASPSIEQKCFVCIQTLAYAGIIEEKHDLPEIKRRYALYLKKDGTYRLFDCVEFEKAEDLYPHSMLYRLLFLHVNTTNLLRQVETVKSRHRREKKK